MGAGRTHKARAAWTRLATMPMISLALAVGLAAGTPSAAFAEGGQNVATGSAEGAAGTAGTDAGEAGTDGTRSTGGEEAAGKGSDGRPRPAGFSPADAAILAVVAVVMAAAVRSVVRRGTKTCGCGCGCGACGGNCGKAKPSPARRLADDEELRARLEETQGRGKARRMANRDNKKAEHDANEAFPDEGVMDDGQAQAILNAVLVAQRDKDEAREGTAETAKAEGDLGMRSFF